jgi:cytochrome P450
MRFVSVVRSEPRRFATDDVEVGGQLIRSGDGVICALSADNRDPRAFDGGSSPERLDLGRSGPGHLGFGYGTHQCLGQNRSRVEMQVALSRLFQRIPKLRLAVPRQEPRFRDTTITYGVRELPVMW